MIAINEGSIMRQVGKGITSAIEYDDVINTVGVAYSLEGGSDYDEQVSMYYFSRIKLFNCAGEDAGYFKLLRSGAIQCLRCEFRMNDRLSREFLLMEFVNGPD